MIRVRFAPSPTGYLHVGGARTALYNYLTAQKLKGTFVLRIEDTDLERSTEESLRMQMDDLKWLGLTWDEGPEYETLKDVGEYGPYRQSQRLEIYQKHIQQLLEGNQAYYCFHTDEEVKEKTNPKLGHFISEYRDLPLVEAKKRIESGESAVVRFRNDKENDYKMNDLVRDEVTFPSHMVGDFVIFRSNGMPVYNFCCVVDDHLMKISHVFRAEEHLSNSLRQLMIYEAFGWEPPQFGHLSLILGEDKQKLSKRHGATSCNEFMKEGYLPEAINNFIALCGWSSPSGKEVLQPSELLEEFSLDRFATSGAVFDQTKLKWMNAMHLRALSDEELWQRVQEYMKISGEEFQLEKGEVAVAAMKPAAETLKEMVEKLRPLSAQFSIHENAKEVLTWESSSKVIRMWQELLSEKEGFISEEEFTSYQDRIKNECEVKGKFLFMPLRVSVIGQPHGVDLQKVVPLIGRQELAQRAGQCLSAAT